AGGEEPVRRGGGPVQHGQLAAGDRGGRVGEPGLADPGHPRDERQLADEAPELVVHVAEPRVLWAVGRDDPPGHAGTLVLIGACWVAGTAEIAAAAERAGASGRSDIAIVWGPAWTVPLTKSWRQAR